MMCWRNPLAWVLSVILVASSVAHADEAKRRIAIVGIGDLSRAPLSWLVDGLRSAGYEPEKNADYLPPVASGGYASLKPLADAAVAKRADVIVTYGDTATRAAMAATHSIPIVMVVNTDPAERGLVKNLARPEGNVTGVAGAAQGLVVKRIELLKELQPRMRRLGVIT